MAAILARAGEIPLSSQIIGFLVIAGLQVGCIYATLALSYYVITRATGILNFAQGEWMMLAAVLGASLLSLRLPYAVAVFASVVLSALVAVAAERLIIRPLENRKAPLDTLIVALLGIMIVVRYGTGLWYGHEEHPLPGPLGVNPMVFADGIVLLPQTLLVFAATAALFIAFWALDRYTRLGLTLRVAAIDSVGAQLCGISLSQVRLVAFGLGGLIAAVVGWLYAPLYAAGYLIGAVVGDERIYRPRRRRSRFAVRIIASWPADRIAGSDRLVLREFDLLRRNRFRRAVGNPVVAACGPH